MSTDVSEASVSMLNRLLADSIDVRQRVLDNDPDYVTPLDMIAELREDNAQLATRLRGAHALCDEHGDVATASLLEVWIDEAERRAWFLFETGRHGEDGNG